jgi:hypothetical protein
MMLTLLSLLGSLGVLLGATRPADEQHVGRNLYSGLFIGLLGTFSWPVLLTFFLAWGSAPTWVCAGLAFVAGFAIAPSRAGVPPLDFIKMILDGVMEDGWTGLFSLPTVIIRMEGAAWLRWLLLAIVAPSVLAFDKGWWSLVCLPAVFVGYTRVLPDWTIISLGSSLRSRRADRASIPQLLSWLEDMPPHAYELTPLPLAGHAGILATLFRVSPSHALDAMRRAIESEPSWAYKRTLVAFWLQVEPIAATFPGSERSALLRRRLMAMRSIHDIAELSEGRDFSIELVLGDLYGRNSTPESEDRWLQSADIEALMPTWKDLAAQTSAAGLMPLAIQRERGYERALASLGSMRARVVDVGIDVDDWMAVIGHWEHLLRDAIEAQAGPRGELLQPFQTGAPLRADRAHLFKGRSRLTEDVTRALRGVGRAPLILHGPRRCGKSSFLLNLSRLLPPEIVPVYVDLQSQAMTSSEGDFCYGIVRAAMRDLRERRLVDARFPSLDRSTFQANPYPVFEDSLDAITESLDGRVLLVCLDEFEKLGEAMERGKVGTALFDELRHLIQHRESLRLVFCGAQTLDELGPRWTNYFINARPIEILYLEPEEARELLEDPDPKFELKYAPGVLDRVLASTACQPYLVQLVGEAMVKTAERHGVRSIDEPLLEEALSEALSAGEIYFANLWDETTGRHPDEIARGQSVLRALAEGTALPPLDATAREALRRLLRYHVITKQEDGYRIAIPLIARWVRERKGEEGVGVQAQGEHA